MRRMILRWVALAALLTLAALGSMRLGEWQLDRLDQRRDRNSAVTANEGLPPVPWGEVMGGPLDEADLWRRVSIVGTYTGEQFQVRYRSLDSNPGIEVAAILRTTDGRELIIDRGFIPREAGKPDTEVLPPPPTGKVTVLGYVHRDEQGDDGAIVPHDFRVRLINSGAIGTSLGRELVPGYVVLISSEPANGDVLQPVGVPDLSEGNHFSYALQWFAFGAIALIGIVVLIRADLKDHQKAQARARRQEQARVGADATD